MTRSRRLCILTFVEQHGRWPGFAEPAERHAILEGGFAFVSRLEVCLTSLGELETGYPETASDLTQSEQAR